MLYSFFCLFVSQSAVVPNHVPLLSGLRLPAPGLPVPQSAQPSCVLPPAQPRCFQTGSVSGVPGCSSHLSALRGIFLWLPHSLLTIYFMNSILRQFLRYDLR